MIFYLELIIEVIMQQFKQFLLTIILTICSHRFLFAQVNPAIVFEIKVYSKQVDSLSKLSSLYNNDLMSTVSEGIIKRGKRSMEVLDFIRFQTKKATLFLE